MSSEIKLDNVVFVKDSIISWVRSVMSSTMVDRNTSGESLSACEISFQIVSLKEIKEFALELLSDVDELLSGLDVSLSVLSDLSMALSSMSKILNLRVHELLLQPHLFGRNS